ncbi:Protein ecm33 [Talaromyces atroroseus]|uniref:Protein ecm33 n=1 Tax=Talaromyces atroroseus TaxID=1441469 RepID=A0A225AEZ4_TALAT|nr:Protein ecm33 [Talaromyces atroroseus]OKL59140.1 Protein ecm33 [Talaromyces atroroseus]
MSFSKYIVPALLASGAAMAASSDNCGTSGSTTNITSQSDADALSSCTTVKGDIALIPGISNGITFNGIEQITGSLIATDVTNLTSLSAPDLTSIADEFHLESIILLTSLSFPELTSVGSISFEALPNLQSLTFTTGVNKSGSVSITNTGLTSLSGIELDTVGDFDLTANTALTSVNVNNIKNITGTLIISANSNKLDVEFPNLVTASNMTFRNTSTISVPSLANLTGELGLFGNYITNFTAPNLTTCADLDFEDNSKLASISLPELVHVTGGLAISNNADLMTINFPKLSTVAGAIDITGDYTNVSLPSLTEVKGGFNAESTGNFSCSAFNKLDDDNVISGSYTCNTTSHPTNLDGSSGSSSTTSSSSSASATSSGAAVGNVAIPSVGFTALVGALLSLLM